MNLEPEQLAAALSKQLPQICVVMGNSDALVIVQDCLKKIRDAATAAALPKRELVMVNSSTDWDELCAHLSSGSLFAERHFVELMVPEGVPAASFKKIDEGLIRVMDALAAEDFLLVSMPGLGKRRPLWRKKEQCWLVTAQRLRGRAEQAWVRRQLEEREIFLDEEQVHLLLFKTEGNLLAALAEINRLALLADTGTPQEVASGEQGQLDVFQLSDACLFGQAARAVRILHIIRKEDAGMAPAVFAVLGRHLLRALKIQANRKGSSMAKAISAETRWPREAKGMHALMARLSSRQIRAIAMRMSSLDAQIKGREYGDAWLELNSLVLAFCGIFPFRRRSPAA